MVKCLLWILTVQIALATVTANIGARVNPGNITNFDTFLGAFNKRYKARYRMDRRKKAFRTNMVEIEEHNENYKKGLSTFKMGINELADMDRTTYLKKMTRMKPQVDHRRMNVKFNDDMIRTTRSIRNSGPMVGASAAGMPDSWDWREKGFKTANVNQKTCGSCYAFSISYAIDAQIMRRIKRIEYVSQQQMVDCSTTAGNQGCAGGSLRYTLQYLQNSGGCMRESDYPYTSSQGTCKFNKDLTICNISEWGILPKKEDALAFALWKVGPIAISLNAEPKSFQLYQSGIYDDALCDNTKMNHAVLLVGYTPKYWIIKNWWGSWGEDGYMKIVRGKNMCGISNYAAFVTIK